MRILFVCTGNICRSPSAEGVLRARLAAAGMADAVAVESCGTHGYHTGMPPDPRAIGTAAARGVDISGLRARPWARADATAFDLVIGMEGHHVRWLERRVPASRRDRVARLLDWAPWQPVRDVPDPYGGALADFARMLDLIELGVNGLMAELSQPAGRLSQ